MSLKEEFEFIKHKMHIPIFLGIKHSEEKILQN